MGNACYSKIKSSSTGLKVWKSGFVKSKKVWNQIKIWTLTSLYLPNLYIGFNNITQTGDTTALLWQKEASDMPSKSELSMFSYFT